MIAPWLFGIALIAAPAPATPQLPADAPKEDSFEAPETYRPLGPALWFDPETRRLILRAQVVRREGFLEHLLCLKHSKEHESILATEATPRLIHAGLMLTGVEPGHPVRYRPEFAPAEGPEIAITVEWVENGQPRSADARTFVQNEASGKSLTIHWVFGGSMEIDRPGLEQPLYAADGGDLITVANFPEAILDLPIASSADDQALNYVANTPVLPPLGDFVTLSFAPVNPPAPDAETNTEAGTEAPPTTETPPGQ